MNTSSPSIQSDNSPFLDRGLQSVLKEIYETDHNSEKTKSFLKGLDANDLFEWAHFKKLRASQQFRTKKINNAKTILREILIGVEEILLEDSEISKRFFWEIQIPCFLQLVSCLVEAGENKRAMTLCDYILKLDDKNEEAKNCRKILQKNLERKENEAVPMNMNPKDDNETTDRFSDSESENKSPEELEMESSQEKDRKILTLIRPLYSFFSPFYTYARDYFSCCRRRERGGDLSFSDKEEEDV